MSVNDYEPLNILDTNTNSKIFKVRNKNTGEHFVWYTIDYENTNNHQLMNLQERFVTRKELQHPNLLEFHDLIKEEATFYLVVKYCKHGSLKDLMDIVYNDNKRFSEEFLCKILYQIAFTIKTIDITTNFGIKDIYFDEDYNVKFLNFDIANNETKLKSQRISSLGALIFEICTLTKFNKKYFDKELKNCNNLYSKEFLSLLVTTIKDSRDLKKNIDKVMCNSILLLKITQWNKYKCFLKIDQPKCAQSNENVEDIYALQIEKLKEKEIILQRKEKMLKEMEHKLSAREKKVTSLEKLLRDNIKQAEEAKSSYNKSCSCPSKVSTVDQKGPIKENLDSTYISCGDSVVMPTSKKLNVREIIKPATFTRTLSEKRIRFKGHSPLKDIDFNRRRSVRHIRFQKDVYVKNGEWTTCSEDTEKTGLQTKKGTNKKCKQLFPTYENNSNVIVNKNVTKSLQWTEENKKYAFELLRLMNKDKENKPTDVKHTYL